MAPPKFRGMGLQGNSNSLAKNKFHVCVSVSDRREIPAKSASYVYLIQNPWRSEFSTYVHVY